MTMDGHLTQNSSRVSGAADRSGRARLIWLIRRLSLMSVPEVTHRLVRSVGDTIGRFTAHRTVLHLGLAQVSGNELQPIAWCSDLADRPGVRDVALTGMHWEAAHAEHLLAHEFTFFALQHVRFGEAIDWNRDYKHGVTAPLTYGPLLDYRDERLCGDIKYAWEHNRHHHLVELAKAAYLTGDLRYEAEVISQVRSWIDASPYPLGINWASALENAIRVINWCFALQFLRMAGTDFEERNREFLRRWTASAYEHLHFISRRFSRHSSANNHLIGEAAGLFIGALYFHFPESPKWLARARRILLEESAKQTWPDGVNKEQAVAYQSFVFDFLLLCGLLGRKNGLEFGKAYWARLERMAEFVAALIDEHGDVPAIGDDDEGRVVQLSYARDFKVYRSLLATAAVLFRRNDFRGKAAAFDEKSFWLLGRSGAESFGRGMDDRQGPTFFGEGGYALFTGGGAHVIVDFGPLGYLSLAAHGHADALSVLLDVRGRHILVDPGTYAYHTQKDWRAYFRGTSAHNTVRIDGLDQSVMGGNFMWLEKATVTMLDRDSHLIRARHDGYARLEPPAYHERTVSLSEERRELVIEDVIVGDGKHSVELFFHFHPDCTLEQVGGGYRVVNGDVELQCLLDPSLPSVQVYRGSLQPVAGWYSTGYDRKIPSPTLVARGEIQGGARFRTIMRFPV